MSEPIEVTRAVVADAIAHRYGVLPNVVLDADAEVFRIYTLAARMQAIRSKE